MDLVCISLVTNAVEHLSVSLLAISIFSLEKYPSNSFAHLLMGLFIFSLLRRKNSSVCKYWMLTSLRFAGLSPPAESHFFFLV